MAGLSETVRSLEERPNPMLVLALGCGVVALLFAAVIGAVAVDDGPGEDATRLEVAGDGSALGTDDALDGGLGDDIAGDPAALDPSATIPGATDTTVAGGGTATTAKPGGGAANPNRPPAFQAPAGSNLPSGVEDRTGVTATEIKVRWHAPKTFDGAPLNLAEDPIEGLGIYLRELNARGGVHGRKIRGGESDGEVVDDRYTVSGGAQAGDAIVAAKPFFAMGTLGVDQINQVALRARKAGIPYMAAGGSEELFKSIGMFQIAASYDTHLEKLAEFLARESKTQGSPYFNKTRVAATQLDTDFITRPLEGPFKRALESRGMQYVGSVKILKPSEQTTYTNQINALRDDLKAQIVVAAQDPISTGRMTKECGAPPAGPGQGTPRCPWMWTFSNFANESDVALQLMAGHWSAQKVRGLAGGCYYLQKGVGKPYDRSQCGMMFRAHDLWVKANGEDDWKKDGSGGASGYQLVYFFHKALVDAGPDPTRERFLAGLLAYDGYDELVSGPITFKGSANIAHGATKMVPFEATTSTPETYQQLTPGFVDGF